MYIDQSSIADSVLLKNGVGEEEGSRNMSLLTEQDLQQLLVWNTTQQAYERELCVAQLVEARTAATPEAIALVADTQVYCYDELNQRANQVAHYLRTLGVGPGKLVGCCMERSLDMLVGLLGILKAGGAYVPLDPNYPVERLAFMLEDASVPVLITQHRFSTLFATTDMHVVNLDTDAAMLAQQSITNPVPFTTPADLAYVIYTSGSTGQPKGVQITHDSLLNLIFWHRQAFVVTPADRATQLAGPAFDAAVWEVWPYLTAGASIYLPDEETRVSSILLRDWLIQHSITITFLPTALAESAIMLEWPAESTLRFLLTGADMLHHYPSAALPFAVINNYGPTEATVVTTSGRVMPNEHADSPPAIGRPIANTQVYILDEHMRQVPPGATGELYIGGAGLAKGYLNRPELTAEKFIPHPFSAEPGARLYKTGDLVYFLPDGQLAFVGRSDHQMKIRGYRIEPNEIVAVLNRYPAIQASIVVAREDVVGDKRLVAYIVTRPDELVMVSGLREHLAMHLPDYMIPATFVQLDALPTTPNGKVDITSLPAPEEATTLRDEVLVGPSTPIEERLERIVATLLGLERVGVEDNFFMLGGHSLLGTQLIVRVADTFGIDLTLRSLFNAPTIQQLAVEVERLIFAKVASLSDEEVQQLLG